MMEKLSKRELVFRTTGKIVNRLSNTLDTSHGRETLANLRNSIGRPVSESIEIWPIMYEDMPEELLSHSGEATAEELSILTAIQLYALHQQGSKDTVDFRGEKGQWDNMGYSLGTLRSTDNRLATDRRFNALITSSTFEELIHHLRQMIKILKSKAMTKVNYARLSSDIYQFLRGYKENMRLNWARAYYSTKLEGEDKNEQE